MSTPLYEVLALRYAHAPERTQGSNLIFPDDHAASMPLDYFVWVIRGSDATILVDTGFDTASAARRARPLLRSPIAALEAVGIRAAEVEDIVLTHLHADHAGHWNEFPRARFHVQDAEMAFCTGRCMCHEPLRKAFDVEHVTLAVRHVFDDRVTFHDGEAEIAPGVTLHLVGGHTGGLQVVRVPTARGALVLASDATHFWHNIRKRTPFVLVHDLERMMEGWRLCESLADGPDHIIPGHDPEVTRRFPKLTGDPDTVELHRPPRD